MKKNWFLLHCDASWHENPRIRFFISKNVALSIFKLDFNPDITQKVKKSQITKSFYKIDVEYFIGLIASLIQK